MSEPNLKTTAETAKLLGVKLGTLEQWRWRGVGPKWVKVGRLVRYAESELNDYIVRTQQDHTPNKGGRGGIVANKVLVNPGKCTVVIQTSDGVFHTFTSAIAREVFDSLGNIFSGSCRER